LPQVEVAGAVVLEGDRAAVVGEGIDLDHERAVAPEEVDLPAADLGVRLGDGEPMACAEGEEVFLEFALQALPLGSSEPDAQQLGLAAGTAEEIWRDGSVEIVDRTLDGGDGDVVAVGDEGHR
jgi:hypothetical protein